MGDYGQGIRSQQIGARLKFRVWVFFIAFLRQMCHFTSLRCSVPPVLDKTQHLSYCQPKAEKSRVFRTALGFVPEEGGVRTPGTVVQMSFAWCAQCLPAWLSVLFCIFALQEN